MMHPLSWGIAAALLFWSTLIAVDQPWPPPAAVVPAIPEPAPPKPIPKPKGTTFSEPRLTHPIGQSIDEAAFKIAFRRQALGPLTDCLKGWREGPQTLLFTANLDQAGHLQQVTAIGSDLPDCARTAITAMEFSHLTTTLTVTHIAIQWRVDW